MAAIEAAVGFRVLCGRTGIVFMAIWFPSAPAGLREVGSNDDISTSNSASVVAFYAAQAGQYYFGVDGYRGDEGLVKLSITPMPRMAALVGVAKQGSGSFGFSILGVAGGNYAVETSTNLVDWVVITNVLSGGGSDALVLPCPLDGGRRFYRLVVR